MLIVAILLVSGVLAILGYLKWKDQKEFLEAVRASAASLQKRNIEQMLEPQLSFAPELQQIALTAILDSADAEVLEKIPVSQNEILVRYRLSVLSEVGARELAGHFLKSYEAKKLMGPGEFEDVIKDQVDKSIPRQVLVGEIQLSKSDGRWLTSSEATQ